MRLRRTLTSAAAIFGAAALALAGCSSPQDAANGQTDDDTPYQVGLITSKSGALANYGAQYLEGFYAGLDYATDGTRKIGNHPIEVVEQDDTGVADVGVGHARDLIADGVKILAGTVVSGVALQIAPIAEQNEVLYISGPAAVDTLTGQNRYTFRSGRQSFQDVLAARAAIGGDPAGKKVVVFAQDTAFGQGNAAAVGRAMTGATVVPILVPESAAEFTTFALQALAEDADLIYVAWAGTTAPAMWTALFQQGVLTSTTVVTGLADRVTWEAYAPLGPAVSFLAHYFDGASDTPASQALAAELGKPIDLFHGDGFTAAQMIVRALTEGGNDVEAMIGALEGYSFEGVKGSYTVRAEDHALLQPMYLTRLVNATTAELVEAIPATDVVPPVTPFAS